MARWVLAVAVLVPLLRFAVDAGRGLDYLHVQYLVDDAFYYFVIARHPPDFNPGIATSGFHPLYLFVASAFHTTMPPAGAILACLGTLSLAHAASVYALYRCVNRMFPVPVALISALGLAISTRVHALAMTGVETMLAVLVVLIFFERFARAIVEDRSGEPRAMAALGGWIGIAFWARMDAPLLLAPAAAWLFFDALRKRRLRAAGCLAALAIVLPLAWMAYIHSVTGSAFPTSGTALRVLRDAAPQFAAGAAAYMRTTNIAVGYLNAYFAGGVIPVWLMAVGIVALAFAFGMTRRVPGFGRFAGALALGVVAWAGYYVLYLGGFRIWYGLYLAIFVYALCVPMLASLARVSDSRIAWVGIAAAVISFSWLSRGGPIAPHEFDKRQAARVADAFLRALPDGDRVAAFNTGIYNFYTSADILNLDGVVNPAAMQAHRDRDIAGYMKRMNVRYLIEHGPSYAATFNRVFRDPALHFERLREVTGEPFAGRLYKRTWLWKVSYPGSS